MNWELVVLAATTINADQYGIVWWCENIIDMPELITNDGQVKISFKNEWSGEWTG